MEQQLGLFDIFDELADLKPEVKVEKKKEVVTQRQIKTSPKKSIYVGNGIHIITGFLEKMDFTSEAFTSKTVDLDELIKLINCKCFSEKLVECETIGDKVFVHFSNSAPKFTNATKLTNDGAYSICLGGFELPLSEEEITLETLKVWFEQYPSFKGCEFIYDENTKVIVPYISRKSSPKSIKLPFKLSLFGRIEKTINDEFLHELLGHNEDNKKQAVTSDSNEVSEVNDLDESEVNDLDDDSDEDDNEVKSNAISIDISKPLSELNATQVEEVVNKLLPELENRFQLIYSENSVMIVPSPLEKKAKEPKKVTYPTEGTTLSFIFNRVILEPSMFGGKKSVTEEELIKFISDDYPEYSPERTTIIYEEKKKLIIPQLKSARKGAILATSEHEVEDILEKKSYALINYEVNGERMRIEKHPIGLFRASTSPNSQHNSFLFALPKIPNQIFYEILANFYKWGSKKKECAASIFYFHHSYHILFPEQRVSYVAVEINYDSIYDFLNSHPGAVYVMEIHSHHRLMADFSNQDNHDELQTLLYGVVGNMNFTDFTCDVALRAGTGGLFQEIEFKDIFAEPLPYTLNLVPYYFEGKDFRIAEA